VLKAILFDFDGTLADSFQAIAASVNFIRQKVGKDSLAFPEIKKHVGYGLDQLLRNMVPDRNPDDLKAEYHGHHKQHMFGLTFLYPGVHEFLKVLQKSRIKSGICSNKPVSLARSLADHLKISEFFDVILGPEDCGKPKPAPDMIVKGMERLQVSGDQVVYLGDMDIDIKASKSAGVKPWIVRHDQELPFDLCEPIEKDDIFVSFEDILAKKQKMILPDADLGFATNVFSRKG